MARIGTKTVAIGGGVLVVIVAVIMFILKTDRLIQDVKFRGIIADQVAHGTEVGQDNKPKPPAPWQTRLKITLNSKKLDELSNSPERKFEFGGTKLDFRPRDKKKPSLRIDGANFKLNGNILLADFKIPEEIPDWNFENDPVFLVVNIIVVGPITQKAAVSLFSLSMANSANEEKEINRALYNKKGERKKDKFTGDFRNGKTRNGLTGGTKIGC